VKKQCGRVVFPTFFRFHKGSPQGSNFAMYEFLKDYETFRNFHDAVF